MDEALLDKYVKLNYDFYKCITGNESMTLDEFKKRPEAYGGWTEPLADEVRKFSPLINALFDTIQEKKEGDKTVLFSVEDEAIKRANERYNADLEAFRKGDGYSPVRLGKPSAALQACGLNGTEMYIKRPVLKKHLDKHGLTVDDIRDLPKALQNPLMVYEWGDKAKSLIAITEKAATEAEQEAGAAETPATTETQEQPQGETRQPAEQQATEESSAGGEGEQGEQQGGGQQSALSQLPKDEQGNPDIEQAKDAGQAVDALVEMAEGSVEDAKQCAQMSLDDAKDALKKAQKAKPKPGANPMERMANIKAQKAAIAEAQKKVDFWQGVADEFKRREEAEKRQAVERLDAEQAAVEQQAQQPTQQPAGQTEQTQAGTAETPAGEGGATEAETATEQPTGTTEFSAERSVEKGEWKPITQEAGGAEESSGSEGKAKTDKQGNPVDEHGKLITEKVNGIDELTDGDFTSAARSVELPKIPENVDKAIGADGKPVIIKKNIFEKNRKEHPDITPQQSREILRKALYSPNLVGQTQPIKRPHYWVAIQTADKNSVVVIEVNRAKDNTEIVGWRFADAKKLEQLKRQAEREGGQFLIQTSEDAAAALSALPSNLSSADKGTTNTENTQGGGAENAQVKTGQELKERANSKASGKKMPESQASKIDLKDFTAEDETRKALTAVYYKDGYMHATNGKVAIKMRADYPEEYEGKMIDPRTGREVEGSYVNIDGAIDRTMDGKNITKVRNEDVAAAVETAKELLKGRSKKGHPVGQVAVALPGSMKRNDRRSGYAHDRMYVDADYLASVADVMRNSDNFELYTTDSSVVYTADGVKGVIMPLTEEGVSDGVVVQDGKVYADRRTLENVDKRIADLHKEHERLAGDRKRANVQKEIDKWEDFRKNARSLDELVELNTRAARETAARNAAKAAEWAEENTGKTFTDKRNGDTFTVRKVEDGKVEWAAQTTLPNGESRSIGQKEDAGYVAARVMDGDFGEDARRSLEEHLGGAGENWLDEQRKERNDAALEESAQKRQAAKEKAAATREENKRKALQEKIRKMEEQARKAREAAAEKEAKGEDGGAGNEAPTQTQEATTQTTNAQGGAEKIDDWGEELEGARKFTLRDLAKKMDKVNVQNLVAMPLSKVFPRQDFAKQVQQGKLSAEDATFLEALQALVYGKRKPQVHARGGTKNVVEWANDVNGILSVMKAYCDAETPEARQAVMEVALSNADIIKKEDAYRDRLRDWNSSGITIGSKTSDESIEKIGNIHSEKPVKVVMDILRRLGYPEESAGKAVFPEIKSNYNGSAYEVSLDGRRKTRECATYGEALDYAVKLAKVARGDNDVTYDKSDFRIRGEGELLWRKTGRYVACVAMKNGSQRREVFSTKEEAEKCVNDCIAEANEKKRKVSYTNISEEQAHYYPAYTIKLKDPLGRAYEDELKIDGIPTFETEKEAQDWMDQNMGELNDRANETAGKADDNKEKRERKVPLELLYEDNSHKTMGVYYKTPIGALVKLKGGFKSGYAGWKEANDWMEGARAMMAQAQAEKEAAQRELQRQNSFRGTETRKGTDWRKGKNITPEEFGNKFGFRGVQFGNWANQEERQRALNEAYDSFMDLAELLGVSPDALSLNGELGIAFGSRGAGRANAHYEPDKVVINLTRTRGAGSLAHEWWHALDNYFSRRGGVSLGMLTTPSGGRLNANARPEVVEAYDNLVKAIEDSDYDKRSRARGAYWGRREEETARLFAEWVDKKLQEAGKKNSFLSSGVDEALLDKYIKLNYDFYKYITGNESMTLDEFKKRPEAYEGLPVPLADEVRKFSPLINALFDTIQEKKEGGKAVLFSVKEREERARKKAEREKVERLSAGLEDALTKLNVPRVVCRSAEEMVSAYRELTGREMSLERARRSNAFVGKVDGEDVVFFNAETLAGGRTAEAAAARGREIMAHEVLGHYGLPVLMGEEGHKKFCGQVYGSMPEAARERFNAYYFDNNLNRVAHRDILRWLGLDEDTLWEELTAEQKSRVLGELGDRMTRGAADEYIAHLAERVERGEVLPKEEKTLWDSIVDAVRRLFGFDAEDETFGDRDIAKAIMDSKRNLEQRARLEEIGDALEEARESGDKKAERRLTKERDAIEKNMEARRASIDKEMRLRDEREAARRDHDVFGEARAVADMETERRSRRGDVRRSAEETEREFMSEEERKEARDYLTGNDYATELTGEEFKKKEGVKPIDAITDFYKEHYNGRVTREGVGTVLLNSVGVGNSLAHYKNRRADRVTYSAFVAVPDIIKKGCIIGHEDNWKGRDYEGTVISAPIRVNGKPYIGSVVITKGKQADNFRFYLHRVNSQKGLLNEISKTDFESETRQGGIAKLLRNIISPTETEGKVSSEGENSGDLGNSISKDFSDLDDREGVRFSVVDRDEGKSLVGVHNIGEDNLRKALKLGGLANPSVAVIDAEKYEHNGYGDISLITPPELIDSKTGRNAGTWLGDAWTPRFPDIREEGGKRYIEDTNIPASLENISKWMNEQRGQGLPFDDFYNNVPALILPKVNSLDKIRENKGRLLGNYDYSGGKFKWHDDFLSLGEELELGHPEIHDGPGVLEEAFIASKGKNPRSYLEDRFGIKLTKDEAASLKDFIKEVRDERTTFYFETKFKRPVYLNEFAGAVVPEGTGEDIVKALRDAGLRVETYEKGRLEDRKRAVNELAEAEDVRFSTREAAEAGERAQQIVDEAEERIEAKRREEQQERADEVARGFGLDGVALPKNAENAEGAAVREAARQGTLRDAMGEDWDEFLKKVYQNTDEETLRDINEYARQNGWNFAEATERYLASLSDNGAFEQAVERGMWNNVREAFDDMLGSRGVEEGVSDNDARYALWRNEQNKTERADGAILARATDVATDRALGNDGDTRFSTDWDEDKNNPDVRYSGGVNEPVEVADILEKKYKGGWFQVKEAWQDSMQSLYEFMKACMGKEWKGEAEVADWMNPYTRENRLSSKNEEDRNTFTRKYMCPMYDAVKKLAKDKRGRELLNNYIMSKHGLERNEYMAEREAREAFEERQRKAKNTAKWDNLTQDQKDAFIGQQRRDYAGLTGLFGLGKDERRQAEDMARSLVDNYEGSHDTDALWKTINAATEATLKKQLDTGLISRETYDKVRSMYQYYIPLRGFDETTTDDEYAYLNHQRGQFESPLRRAKGRTSVADDPFSSIVQMAQSAILHGNRNQLVKQAFYNFVGEHPSDYVTESPLWLERQPDGTWQARFCDTLSDGDTPEEVSEKLAKFEEDMKRAQEAYPDMYATGEQAYKLPYRMPDKKMISEHQVVVRMGGQDKVLTVNGNPRLAQAINGQTNPDIPTKGWQGALDKTLGNVVRFGAAVHTTWNPDFMVSNYLRDLGYSNVMSWVKENNPSYQRAFAANCARVSPVTVLTFLDQRRRGTLGTSGKLGRYFEEYMSNGGETGYARMAGKDKIRKELAKRMGMTAWDKTKDAYDAIGELAGELGRGIEISPRFAAYVTSREAGRDIGRAIYDAKEITVNFNKKGAGSTFLGANGQTAWGNTFAFISGVGRDCFMFWNAGVQGTANIWRNSTRNKKSMAKAAAAFGTLALLGYMRGMCAGGDDEKKKKDVAEHGDSYWDLPAYTRHANFCYRGKGGWTTIPLAIEFRLPYGIGEIMAGYHNGQETETQALFDAADLAGDIITPINLMEGQEPGNYDLAQPIMPSPLRPLYDAKTNRSWTGRNIYSPDMPWNKNEPRYKRAYKNAGKFYIGLSKGVGKCIRGGREMENSRGQAQCINGYIH